MATGQPKNDAPNKPGSHDQRNNHQAQSPSSLQEKEDVRPNTSPSSSSSPTNAGDSGSDSGDTPLPPLKKKKSGINLKTAVGALALLLFAIGGSIGFYFVQQGNLDNRNQAAVFDLDNPDEEYLGVIETRFENNGRSYYIDLNNLNEPARTNSTLVFVNAIDDLEPSQGEELTVHLTQNGNDVVNEGGIAAAMATEYIIAPGQYYLEITGKKNVTLFSDQITIAPDEAVFAFRVANVNGAAERITIQRTKYADLADFRLYNFTTDDTLNVFEGTLAAYNAAQTIPVNGYRDLIFSAPYDQTFSMRSNLPSLRDRTIHVLNQRQAKVLLFAFGDREHASITGQFIPLPSQFIQTKVTQKTTPTDTTTLWCEGAYACQLVNPTYEEAGKKCFLDTRVCAAGSNGGSGTQWNQQKTQKPAGTPSLR